MKLAEIQKILNAKIVWGEHLMDIEVATGFGCDLISDCLSCAQPEGLMLTGMCNTQAIQTAVMLDARAILIIRGKQPCQEMVALTKEKGLPLLATNKLMFDCCGLLSRAGLVLRHRTI